MYKADNEHALANAFIFLIYFLIHICSGGIVLMFIGTNLDVVQNPMLVVDDPQYLNIANVREKQHYKLL